MFHLFDRFFQDSSYLKITESLLALGLFMTMEAI
jgi:hypothetical protein